MWIILIDTLLSLQLLFSKLCLWSGKHKSNYYDGISAQNYPDVEHSANFWKLVEAVMLDYITAIAPQDQQIALLIVICSIWGRGL